MWLSFEGKCLQALVMIGFGEIVIIILVKILVIKVINFKPITSHSRAKPKPMQSYLNFKAYLKTTPDDLIFAY